jgi:hypothetical protein
MTDETERRARQMQLIVAQLREHGDVSAHDMLLFHGISRTAAYICLLRKLWGADSIVTEREYGHMATYHMARQPDSWDLPPRKPRVVRRWRCAVDGTVLPASELTIKTPSVASGECPTCGLLRTFRFG